MSSPSCVALIPARGGSKRVPGKNVRALAGAPLLAYTVVAALESGVFQSVMVSTDCEKIAEIACSYGASVPFLRPSEYAGDLSPDIAWLRYTLARLQNEGTLPECFSLLRPTSPFRRADTIQRAWRTFMEAQPVDSLRAVELCSQHPGKMWRIVDNRLEPIMRNPDPHDTPWHSQPYQALPRIYSQNASLEIAWCRVVLEDNSISGASLVPFLTEGYEGLDINSERDWFYAEHLLQKGDVHLPELRIATA